MTDALPWIIALVVLAAVVGYFSGHRAGSRSASQPDGDPRKEPAVDRSRTLNSETEPARPMPSPTPRSPIVATPDARLPTLGSIRSWGYQLQDIDIGRATQSPFDLLVLDRTRDGSEKTALRPTDLQRLQRKPDGGRRVVVSYCSIGEAETYRPYWRQQWKTSKPSWMLGENPDWEGNYSVCFWEPGWQGLMFGSPEAEVDRIIAQGFDGIYLDKCDVVDDLREHFKAAARSRKDLDGDMVEFVCRLSAYCKARRPGFVVVMQNAESLLERPELRAAIDAVAKEELVFGIDAPEKPNSQDDVTDSREMLDLAIQDGKPVFVVEYLNNASKIARAKETAAKLGYVLYVADKDRELDRLSPPPSALT